MPLKRRTQGINLDAGRSQIIVHSAGGDFQVFQVGLPPNQVYPARRRAGTVPASARRRPRRGIIAPSCDGGRSEGGGSQCGGGTRPWDGRRLGLRAPAGGRGVSAGGLARSGCSARPKVFRYRLLDGAAFAGRIGGLGAERAPGANAGCKSGAGRGRVVVPFRRGRFPNLPPGMPFSVPVFPGGRPRGWAVLDQRTSLGGLPGRGGFGAGTRQSRRGGGA